MCVVPLLNHPHDVVRRAVWHAVLQLFSSDPLGEATAEVVQIISKTIKNKRQSTHTHSHKSHILHAAECGSCWWC